jgi:hypothetical protein
VFRFEFCPVLKKVRLYFTINVMDIYVCMYVCMHVCVCVMYMCMYVRVYVCVRAHLYVNVCMYLFRKLLYFLSINSSVLCVLHFSLFLCLFSRDSCPFVQLKILVNK